MFGIRLGGFKNQKLRKWMFLWILCLKITFYENAALPLHYKPTRAQHDWRPLMFMRPSIDTFLMTIKTSHPNTVTFPQGVQEPQRRSELKIRSVEY